MDLPDKTALFEVMIAEAVAYHEGRLTEVTMRQAGSDTNTLLMAGVALGDEVCYQIYKAIKDSNIRTAEGSKLDTLMFDWFSLTRLAAASAIVPVTFTRTGTTVGTLPAGTMVTTETNISFATVADLDFTAGDLALIGSAVAVNAGPSGNVGATAINQMTPPAFDSTMVVSNAERAVGGKIQESDAEFRRRAAEFWVVQQKATIEAVLFGCRQVPGVAYASLTETDANEYSRYVEVVIADEGGGSNSLLEDAVVTELNNWRACGVWVQVLGGTKVDLPITMTYSYAAGYNPTTVDAQVMSVLTNHVNTKRLGESVEPGVLKELARKVIGVAGTVAVSDPPAEVIPDPDQLLRVSTITLN